MARRPTIDPRLAHRTKARRSKGPARRAARPPSLGEQLFLGQWLHVLEEKQNDVAKRAGIGKSYMNQLISERPKKKNPSAVIMLRISRVLGLTVNDLYAQPPAKDQVEEAKRQRPGRVAAWGGLLSELSARR